MQIVKEKYVNIMRKEMETKTLNAQGDLHTILSLQGTSRSLLSDWGCLMLFVGSDMLSIFEVNVQVAHQSLQIFLRPLA